MQETPETADSIIAMIAEFEVAGQNCIERARELQKGMQ
jgi:hypothetical protein